MARPSPARDLPEPATGIQATSTTLVARAAPASRNDPLVQPYRATPANVSGRLRGYSNFLYYANDHWKNLGWDDSNKCGPAAVLTLARWKRAVGALRRSDLHRYTTWRYGPNYGPLGTSITGLTSMLDNESVPFAHDQVSGIDSYIQRICRTIADGNPALVLVDWGGGDKTGSGAHYMVGYAHDDNKVFFTNTGAGAYSFSDLHEFFEGHIMGFAGFWNIPGGFTLLWVHK